MNVGRISTMLSTILSTRPSTAVAKPTASCAVSSTLPKEWDNGSHSNCTSSARRRSSATTAHASYVRFLLTHRRNLKRKFLDIETAVRHLIKTFGLKLGSVGRGEFEERVRELVAHDPLILGIADCMRGPRAALWQEYLRLHKLVVAVVRKDELCRRFMGIPGVGPISALAFRHRSTIRAGFDARRPRRLSRIDGEAVAVGFVDRCSRPHLEGGRRRRSASAV